MCDFIKKKSLIKPHYIVVIEIKVQHGIVFAVRKKGDNNSVLLDEYIKKTWTNPEELHHLITNQPKLQDVILQLLLKQVSEHQ